MKKILVVFGTRPEGIKLAAVVQRLKNKKDKFKTVVCITGQHEEMLSQVLKSFNISADYDLKIMQKGQSLFDIFARCLTRIKIILEKESPDLVIVQGDTATAFVAGLAAFYFKIPVAHIEAGLRTNNKYNPFPEEINRRLLSVLADFHFAPTESARLSLLREGIPSKNIWVSGNTVVDSLLIVKNRLEISRVRKYWLNYFKKRWNFNITKEANGLKLILVTGHRRENFGAGFRSICFALRKIAKKRKDVVIIYPVHLNPNVQVPVKEILSGIPNIHLIEPIEYEPFVFLMANSYIILTDSGGIQEEAPSLGKPVLIMRRETERLEAVRRGGAKLVGVDVDRIVSNVERLLDNNRIYKKMSNIANPFGDGKAAKRITKILEKELANV